MSTDEVRVNDPAIPLAPDHTSLASSTSDDDDKIDSGEDMPPLARPSPDDSSTNGDLSDDLSSSTHTTLDATIPNGVLFEPITVLEVEEGCSDGENALDVPVIDATNLQPGEVLDTTVPVPEEMFVPDQDVSTTRRTRSGRQVFPPSRYRDTSLTIMDGTPHFSIFDVDDDLDEDVFETYALDENNGNLFGAPMHFPLLHREVYGLTASPTHIQECEEIVRAALQKHEANLPQLEVCQELSLVGAPGTAFTHTTDLQVKKLKEALASPQRDQWMEAIEDEFDRFDKHGVFEVVPAAEMPMYYKALSSVWTLKRKANGIFRARLTMRGYEQIPGLDFSPAWKSALVKSAVTVRIVVVLFLMMGGYAHIVDVCSAFLLGLFSNGERLYATVLEGWEHKFPPNALLLLMRTVYGLKQAANCFYRLPVSVMTLLFFTKSLADPCLYHKWDPDHGLLLWISYCDDLMCIGRTKASVLDEVGAVKQHFNVDEVGVLADYLGCNLTFDWDARSCRFTHSTSLRAESSRRLCSI